MNQTADGCTPVGEDQLVGELADLCEQRAHTYGLLSRLFRAEVDGGTLAQLREMKFPARTGSDVVDAGQRMMASYIAKSWGNTVTELAVDYARTFIGHGVDAFSAAFPFESVYTSEKRLLMQEARDEVLAIYRSEGLEKAETWREGEDHIALELEFLQFMAERTAQALRDGDESAAFRLLSVQRNFLTDHVCAWAPMMTLDMRKFAQTDFYQGLARIADGFLEGDRVFINEVLQDEEGE